MNFKLVFFLCTAVAAVHAQEAGISVSVSRYVTLRPSVATMSLGVLTDISLTTDQVVAKLKDLGVTADNVQDISLIQVGPPIGGVPPVRLSYTFQFSTAIDKLKETTDIIARIRRNEPDIEIQGFATFLGARREDYEEARQRVLPELVDDAKREAERIATVLGRRAGAVLAFGGVQGGPPIGLLPGQGAALNAFYNATVRFALE